MQVGPEPVSSAGQSAAVGAAGVQELQTILTLTVECLLPSTPSACIPMTVTVRRRQRRLPSSLLLLVAVLISRPGQCAGGAEESTCSVDDEEHCVQNDKGSAQRIIDEDCVDEDELCRDWANAGECTANPSFMLHVCRRSCNACEYELKDSDFGKPQRIPPHRSREVKNSHHSLFQVNRSNK